MKTALVVDNSRFVRTYIKEILRENDIETIAEAGDVQEAIDAYQAYKPDLVTLDIIMPGGSGLLVLKNIHERHDGARVIIVSDIGSDNSQHGAMALGASAVLRKPLTSDGLKEALACIASNPSASKEAASVAGKLRALIVDDSAVMRAMVREVLEEYGVAVIGEADDVKTGIEAYEVLRPDVVTVDVVMPGGSGMDVLKRIKWINPEARVIMVTSVSPGKN